ncbi:Polypeptide N-acetylgalactosaminyltransferase 3 [Bienertia sinuspersici]
MLRACFWCDFAKDWCSSLSLEEREVLPPAPENTGVDVAQSPVAQGMEVAVEFKPVEHPVEPHDSDKPVQCPLPEPSILNMSFDSLHLENPRPLKQLLTVGIESPLVSRGTVPFLRKDMHDGRIWKERISAAHVRRRTDLPLVREGSAADSKATAVTRSQTTRQNRMMLPSISAPEHNLVNLLEECTASGII